MKEKYEFTFQMAFEDTAKLSFTRARHSFFLVINRVYYILSNLFIMFFIAIFIGVFNKNASNFWLIIPVVITMVIVRLINYQLKYEMLKMPVFLHENHLILTQINIQESYDGYLTLVPYKHVKFMETSLSFGFIYNIMMIISIPKRLFANQTEIDEFRLFVQENILTSKKGASL